jgi:hypothetical protein
MSRAAFLTIMAAMIAGAIGFGIAVYVVPLEEIAQFRALVDAGLGVKSATNNRICIYTGVQHSTNSSSNAATEFESPEQRQSDSNSNYDPYASNCIDRSLTKATAAGEIPNRDVRTPNTQSDKCSVLQNPGLENAFTSFPPLAPDVAIDKVHGHQEVIQSGQRRKRR